MIRINPTKILVGGDKIKAKNFIGNAKSQLEILKQSMSFQNLSQGVRKLWLNDDVYIECRKSFNYQECKVWVRPIIESIKDTEFDPTIILIISLPSEEVAFSWDLLNNVLLPSDWNDIESPSENTLSFFTDKLIENNFTPPIQLTYSGKWERTYLGYDISGIIQDDNLPYPLYGYPWSINSVTAGGNNAYDIVVFNPNIDDWNYEEYERRIELGESIAAFSYYLWISPNSFYMIDTVNSWKVGDFIKFSTVKESDSVNIIEKNSLGGFNPSGLTSSILGSITETWTAVVTAIPSGFFGLMNIHIYGDTIGPVLDSPGGSWTHLLKSGLNTNNVLQYYPWEFEGSSTPPNISVKYIELSDEYEKAYAAYFYKGSNGYKKELWENIFNSKTGLPWPQLEGEYLDYIIRNLLFYNSVFGKPFEDETPHLGRLEAYTNFLYDSWDDGNWSEPGKVESSSGEILDYPDYERNIYGLWTDIGVSKTYNEESPEDPIKQLAWIVFDAVCFCADPENYIPPEDSEINKLETKFNIHYRMKDFLSGYEKIYFDLVNAERESRGITPLIQNNILQETARIMASALIEANAAGIPFNEEDPHKAPDGSYPEDRAESAGYYLNINKLRVLVAENLLRLIDVDPSEISPEDGVAVWMDSAGHRENILNESYTESGLSFLSGSNNFHVVCQVFGNKDGVWPGFVAMDTSELEAYINKFLKLNDIDENGNFLKIYTAQKTSI